ncbi:DedA family protein, partial [Pseudomonas aeruginosa]|nr:DedA family protein [Pseudomonas aeruginosa]
MLTDWAAYAGLFLSAFGSATLLPLQSETVLAALLLRGGQSV